MSLRPVLYLDIDDTLLTYASGHPEPARGVNDFLTWALNHFEVRWLSRWCPSGEMPEPLLRDLSRMVSIDARVLASVRGADWSQSHWKADGILWLEHLALQRPFVWLEDEMGITTQEIELLSELGFATSYHYCNVTREPAALERLHRVLGAYIDRGGPTLPPEPQLSLLRRPEQAEHDG